MTKGIRTISPIDNSVYVQRDYPSKGEIGQVLELASIAQKKWKTTSLVKRKELCSKAVDAFVAKKKKNCRRDLLADGTSHSFCRRRSSGYGGTGQGYD